MILFREKAMGIGIHADILLGQKRRLVNQMPPPHFSASLFRNSSRATRLVDLVLSFFRPNMISLKSLCQQQIQEVLLLNWMMSTPRQASHAMFDTRLRRNIVKAILLPNAFDDAHWPA